MVKWHNSGIIKLNIGQVLICDFIKRKKERGEYSAILNEQAWSIKCLLYGQKVSLYLRDQRGKSRAPRAGSQSKCRIRFILPTLGFRNIIKIVIYSQSFRRASCRLPATWFGLKSDWFVWISVTGVATRTSKKKIFRCRHGTTTTWNVVERRLIEVVTARRPNFLSLR